MAKPYMPPTALGQGVNTFLNEGVSTALNVVRSSNTGGSTTGYVRVCTSIQEVFEAVDLSLSINVIEPGWSANAKAELVENIGITSTSVTIAVYTSIRNTHSVTESALRSNLPTNLETFFSSYGDSYVSSITTGAEYIAFYTFYATTVTEQTQLLTQINGMGLTWSASLQADLNSLTSSTTVSSQLSQQINGITGVGLPPATGIVAFALGFGERQPNSPVVLAYDTSGYETVNNPPWDNTSPIVQNRVRFLGTLDAGVAGEIAELVLISNTFSSLQKLYTAYHYTDPTITAPLSALRGDLSTASAYLTGSPGPGTGVGVNPTALVTAPTFATLRRAAPLPAPSFAIRQVAFPANMGEVGLETPFGGDITSDWVASATLPSQILLFKDAAGCTGLHVTYRDAGGRAFTENGGGGSVDGALVLQAGEYIAAISGTGGHPEAFGHLTITTSLGTSITSTGPLPGGTPFAWSANPDAAFLGFSGNTGTPMLAPFFTPFVVNLILHYVVFAPAVWRALPEAAVAMVRPHRAAKAA